MRSEGETGALTSASLPPVGADDHVRGHGVEAIIYLDLACPACARTWLAIRDLPLRTCVRHLPIASKWPRSPTLHAAAEAASAQRSEAFWEMVDSIYADQGHTDDPHLWHRVEQLALDLVRFERDRRSEEIAARVRRDFQSGIRAGVTGTPTGFLGGAAITRDLVTSLREACGRPR